LICASHHHHQVCAGHKGLTLPTACASGAFSHFFLFAGAAGGNILITPTGFVFGPEHSPHEKDLEVPVDKSLCVLVTHKKLSESTRARTRVLKYAALQKKQYHLVPKYVHVYVHVNVHV
jgi:hypothetical protein